MTTTEPPERDDTLLEFRITEASLIWGAIAVLFVLVLINGVAILRTGSTSSEYPPPMDGAPSGNNYRDYSGALEARSPDSEEGSTAAQMDMHGGFESKPKPEASD